MSSFVNANCKYVPTCSEYARQCFDKYPTHKALLKTIWRLLRCNPFSRGGLDLPILLFAGLLTTLPADTTVKYITSNEVNLRAGPGERYGVKAKLSAKGFPVIVVREMSGWSKIITHMHDTGWIKNNFIKKNKNNMLVITRETYLMQEPEESSRKVALIGKNRLVELRKSTDAWKYVQVKFDGTQINGWIKDEDLWGNI